MKLRNLSLLAVLSLSLAAGCATQINVHTEPGGAKIRSRGEGRAAFRWKDAPSLGDTSFKVRYGRISVYALWPDNVRSEKVTLPLSMWRDVENITLVRPDAAAPAAPAN